MLLVKLFPTALKGCSWQRLAMVILMLISRINNVANNKTGSDFILCNIILPR
jgi:hypothetical protein